MCEGECPRDEVCGGGFVLVWLLFMPVPSLNIYGMFLLLHGEPYFHEGGHWSLNTLSAASG